MATPSPEGPLSKSEYVLDTEALTAESFLKHPLEALAPAQPEAPSIETIREEVAQIFEFPTEVKTELEPQSTDVQLADVPLISRPEKARKPKFTLRGATAADIDAIVDVDIRSFDSVYSNYGQTDAELRQDLRQKFLGRLEKVGGYWAPVLERDGEIVGFMMSCPTSKTPEEFESWEKTTDDGTLETTYDPNGKNLYVVTLSVLPEGSEGKDMLYGNSIGKVLSNGIERAFFESRLPGLRSWVLQNKCEGSDEALVGLTEDQRQQYADEYFSLKTVVKGKEVRHDRLIRLYERIGCLCERVVPNAYQDEPSMDFGVVCVYDGKKLFDGSDIPFKIPDNRVTRWVFGKLLQGVSHSPAIIKKLF